MTNIPGSFIPIQQESVQFNQPVSESSLTAIGAAINGLLGTALIPVGSIIMSMLTEAQFRTQMGDTPPFGWALCNGQSVAGSMYQTITGSGFVPDMRAIFPRGQDGGRGLNPDGNLALGTFTDQRFSSHNHAVTDPGHTHFTADPQHNHAIQCGVFGGGGGTGAILSAIDAIKGAAVYGSETSPVVISPNSTAVSIQNSGSSETSPVSVTVNFFIRIN